MLEEMEEKTAGGIIKKFKAVIESDYFAELPSTAIITKGIIENALWSKSETLNAFNEIYRECKAFID